MGGILWMKTMGGRLAKEGELNLSEKHEWDFLFFRSNSAFLPLDNDGVGDLLKKEGRN